MTAIGMTGTVGGIAITSTGVGIAPGLAISGAGVVVSAAGVAVTEAGTATLGRTGNSLSDNIQNFKDSGNNTPQNVQNSIKNSPNYPEGFKERQNGTTKNNVKNKDLLDELRKIEPGEWNKVYKDGYDASGNKISIHYFQSKSGKVFDVKVKNGWSN